MTYTLLHAREGSIMLDRVMANDYMAREGGIREADGDLSVLTWPMLAYGHWGWNRVHPGPGKGEAWMDNLYPEGGGSAEYRIYFFEDLSPPQLGTRAAGLYSDSRKHIRLQNMYRGWEKYHRPPEQTIGFFAFVGNWGELPYGGSGSIRTSGAHYLQNLKRMRAILDAHGMKETLIYFWVMLYDQVPDDPKPEGGWGRFPLDAQDLKDFYAQLRSDVHDIRLGVYVNFWICSVKAKVYQDHPEWFANEFHTVDSGGDAYTGKLPQWGQYLAGQMPGLLKAYDLDFIFFDGADWTTRWRGTHDQCRDFYKTISDTMHAHGAQFVANSDIPYVDIGMYECDAGDSEQSDLDLAANLESRTFHDLIFSPFFAWRNWDHELVERSGKSILAHFADKPRFIVRWPVHFRGEQNEHMLKDFFVPFVKRRAAALDSP